MELIDGKAISAQVREEVKAKVDAIGDGTKPGLTLVQVGEDPASSVYVKTKAKVSKQLGIHSVHMHLPEDTSEQKLLGILRELSNDDVVHGILLQLPLPAHIDADLAIATINPLKDVDGFHPENIGLLASGKPRYVACTPAGIREMLIRCNIETSGKTAAVVGRSLIVGKPMALLLSMKGAGGDATVTICHSRTPNLGAVTAGADIVIAALGRAQFLTADMIKEGAVVVDVGINRIDDSSAKKGYRLVGDVDFENVSKKASWITPVPGGVGPMTVAMLMANTMKAYALQAGNTNAV